MTPPPKSANQAVAFNLKRARERAGLTQEQAAELLEPYLGVRWSKSTFSAAESSANPGARRREFTADEIMAFAAGFKLPPSYFLLPNAPATDRLAALVRDQVQNMLEKIGSTRLTVASLREAANALERLEQQTTADLAAAAEKVLPDDWRKAI